jgi:hypothetical protein
MIQLCNFKQDEDEIINIFSNKANERYSEMTNKLANLMRNTPIGSLSEEFLTKISNDTDISNKIPNWKLYIKLDEYTRIKDDQKKQTALAQLTHEISEKNKRILSRSDVLSLTKSIYLSQSIDLIDLFYKLLPHPPLSMFEKEHQPRILIEEENKLNQSISKFKESNKETKKLDSKIIFIQRHIRHKLRLKSEIQRLSTRYFENDPAGKVKAKEMMEQANTPYVPQRCKKELAERIFTAASSIKHYESVYHMLDTTKINSVLDSCLFGQNNLLCSYINFRPASLRPSDVANGDGNVICMGPDQIDSKCLMQRTVRLELDLEVLLDKSKFKNNPTIFFKQNDFGYCVGSKTIKLGEEELKVILNKNATFLYNSKGLNLQFLDYINNTQFYSEINKDLFISYNVKQMDKIIILNFFRFLDSLKLSDSINLASDKINNIYNSISALKEEDLSIFLKELGQKMSSGSELNFSGAYKIDLKALKSLTFYQDEYSIAQINIKDLCDELNNDKLNILHTLNEYNPEIFKSTYFIEFLSSQVKSQVANTAILEIVNSSKSHDTND